MQLRKDQLKNVYSSLVDNELRILSFQEIQDQAWVEGNGEIACTFEDVVGGFLEDVEILLNHQGKLPKDIQNIIPLLKELYKKVAGFYQDIIENHMNIEVRDIIKENKWKIIQKDAQELYKKERM